MELVVQDGRRLRLTAAARILLDHTDELFATWERVRAEVAASAGDQGGELRLCGFSTAAAALLPPVVAQRHGAASATAGCRSSRRTPRSASTCCSPTTPTWPWSSPRPVCRRAPTPGSSSGSSSRTRSTCWCPDSHPLAARPSVALAELVHEPWIMDRPGRPYHQLLQTACASAGFTPVVAHQAAEWDTGAALVAAGLGIALIPRLAHLPMGYPVDADPARRQPDPHASPPHRDPARQRRPPGRRAGAGGARRHRRRGRGVHRRVGAVTRVRARTGSRRAAGGPSRSAAPGWCPRRSG